jgi:hypothetical protein
VNSNDDTESALLEQLFLYLDKLTSKYGQRAYFLTIRADFIADGMLKRELLHQAYELASSAQEHANLTEAAQSLAWLAITDFPDIESAEHWLEIARQHLSRFDNNGSYREEDADLQRALDEMRQKRRAH